MFRSPRLGCCATRSKPGARLCRGYALSFSPSRQTTLNGMLRIGLSAQKVSWPERKPAPLLDSSREFSSCAIATSIGMGVSLCAATLISPSAAIAERSRFNSCCAASSTSKKASSVSRKSSCHSESGRGLLNPFAREKRRSTNSTKFPRTSTSEPSISSNGKISSNNWRAVGRSVTRNSSAPPVADISGTPRRASRSAVRSRPATSRAGPPPKGSARCCASMPQRIAHWSTQRRIFSISGGAI